MSSPYFISINGADQVRMEALKLAFASLELNNLQPDVASLRWTRRKASEAPPFQHNDTVEIFRQGRRLFYGRARMGTINAEGCVIRILGPFSHLDEQTYQVNLSAPNAGDTDGYVLGDSFSVTYPPGTALWNGSSYVTIPSSHTVTWTVATRSSFIYPATTGTIDVNMVWTARHYLFKPATSGTSVYTTIQEEWVRLLAFLTATNASEIFTADVVDLGADLAPRVRTISDTKVSEVLRQILSLKPDAAVWFDYGDVGVPKINLRVASLETAESYAVGSGDGKVLSNYQLRIAEELVPSGVVIRWEHDASSTTGLGKPYLADFFPGSEVLRDCDLTSGSNEVDCESTADLKTGMTAAHPYIPSGSTVTAILSGTRFRVSSNATSTSAAQRILFRAATGAASYEPGCLVHTVTEDIALAPGIAKQVYTSLSVRRATGQMSLLDRDFTLGLRPGKVITLTGDAALSDVQLWVQAVSWNPATGLADITVGYPPHLQLRDMIDLKGWLRASFSTIYQTFTWLVPPP